MEFTARELKMLLSALYKFRSEVSGFSQAERGKLEQAEAVISKIESEIGPLKAEKTVFDRQMEENLSSISPKTSSSKKKKK